MNTPRCVCGSNDSWVIGRCIEERQTWNPETEQLQDKFIECTELWVFCSSCGHDPDPEEYSELFTLLESS